MIGLLCIGARFVCHFYPFQWICCYFGCGAIVYRGECVYMHWLTLVGEPATFFLFIFSQIILSIIIFSCLRFIFFKNHRHRIASHQPSAFGHNESIWDLAKFSDSLSRYGLYCLLFSFLYLFAWQQWYHFPPFVFYLVLFFSFHSVIWSNNNLFHSIRLHCSFFCRFFSFFGCGLQQLNCTTETTHSERVSMAENRI